jgi:transcriptional regulator, XRE family
MAQNKLATEAGISASYVASLEKGEKCPTVETLEYICYALNVSLVEFFTDNTAEYDKLSALNDKQKKLLNEFLKSLSE